ncbi:hypothetical protein BDZ45DRAFT_804283 [Acephala macrosclerotiorum]|nr:hypothetical protein BDZ45DRAFT_804283 [Acephala macrosclerotiorum]
MSCSFTLFLKLPIELQNTIWQMTLSGPRAIGGEECFQEWWHSRLARFLSPVALHVCHNSRSLAKKILRGTTVHIPGLFGWRTLYINQKLDFLHVTKRDVQRNIRVSRFIADPALVNRLVISGVTKDKEWLEKDYFDQFANLEEVVLTDQGRLYQIQKRDLPNINCSVSLTRTPKAVQQLQDFFEDKGRNVVIDSYWFNRN